jgi:hypothetical protein
MRAGGCEMKKEKKSMEPCWPLWSAALALALSASMVSRGDAATIVVDGSGCTLNNAIKSANTDTAVSGCIAGSGDDILDLQANVSMTDNLEHVTSTITVAGNNKIIDGKETYSLFVVTKGDLTINDATITGGSTKHAGGGVYNLGGSVTLHNCVITGNSASRGGGVANYGYESETELIITDSTISSNTAEFSGGGVDNQSYDLPAHVNIKNSIITGNYVSRGPGGGVSNYAYYGSAMIVISNSKITGNTADEDGGGVQNYGYGSTGTIDMVNSTISGNTSGGDGGGIDNKSKYYGNCRVAIDSSVIRDNTAGKSGKGGGISNQTDEATAVLEVTDSLVTGNVAGDAGGGLASSTYIGTINMTVVNTTISRNQAKVGGGTSSYNYEGNSHITITASTITGNSADDNGGGVRLQDGLQENQTTIAGNIFAGNSAPVGAEFSKVPVPPVSPSLQGFNLFGCDTVVSADALSGITTGVSDLLMTSDSGGPLPLAAILSPLANNGGPTMTYALPEGSPALDFIPTPICSSWSLKTDQRGFHRPSGAACDAGAYEYKLSSLLLQVVPIISSGADR